MPTDLMEINQVVLLEHIQVVLLEHIQVILLEHRGASLTDFNLDTISTILYYY